LTKARCRCSCDVLWAEQTVEQSGFLRSMNAPNASLAAGSPSMRPKLAPSSAITSITCLSWPFFIRRLVSIKAMMGLAAILRAAVCA